MTYTEGSSPDYDMPTNLSPRHRSELMKARGFLESIAHKHPEWIVRKIRR